MGFFNLFGFKFLRNDPKEELVSFVAPVTEGTVIESYGNAMGHFGVAFDMEGAFRSEKDIITRYREISMYSEVDSAIQDIVNEAITTDGEGDIITLDLSNLDDSVYTKRVKEKIREEFDNVLSLYNFKLNAADLFRKWYVDGRIYFHLVLDSKNPKNGIYEVRPIDSTKMKRVVEIKKEQSVTGVNLLTDSEAYYVYSETGSTDGIKISVDSIASSTSGLIDGASNITLGHLHKAMRPANQLRMIEDANIIYFLSRAPERRIFKINVGNQPKQKAEQFMREMINQYRNKQVYDPKTGEIKDGKKFLSMMEDFWIPVRDGDTGTSISTLEGGKKIGDQIESIEYFRKKLFSSLNIPVSRITGEAPALFNTGKPIEVARDEIKFSKFVENLRIRFVNFLVETLRVQLLLKGVMTIEDWEKIQDEIVIQFSKDNHFAEMKDLDVLKTKAEVLQQIDQFVGKYFSKQYIMKNTLNLTDEEMEEMEKQIQKEAEKEQPSMEGEEDQMGGELGSSEVSMEPTFGEPGPEESPFGEVPAEVPGEIPGEVPVTPAAPAPEFAPST